MLCSLVDSCSSLDLHLVFQCCLIAVLDGLLHAEQLQLQQCSIALIACTSGVSLDGSWQVPMTVSLVALQSRVLAVSHFETALMCMQSLRLPGVEALSPGPCKRHGARYTCVLQDALSLAEVDTPASHGRQEGDKFMTPQSLGSTLGVPQGGPQRLRGPPTLEQAGAS